MIPADVGEHRADLDDHAVPLGGGEWSVWRDALLRSAGFPADGLTLLTEAGCAAVADKHLAGDATGEEFGEAFARAARRNSARIHALASSAPLREAIIWQNRPALVTVNKLLEAGTVPRRTARHRARERMLVRYWQRYCGKAETVGFFGPVCWARITADGPTVRTAPGQPGIASRDVHFEYWALSAFAGRLASDPLVRAWLPPVLSPELALRGLEVLHPVRPPVRLTMAQSVVVSLCDGRTPARQVAARALQHPRAGLRGAADSYLLLEQLVRRGILRWDFGLPVSLDAERVLRERIAGIADAGVRAAAEAKLDLLSIHRDRVAGASGNASELEAALARLDDVFTSVSGHPPSQGAGQMYAGRRLCVEDTTRNLDVSFGGPLLSAISAPLGIVLTVTRWLCQAMADAYLGELGRLYAELAAGSGTGEVPLGMLWFLAQDSFYGEDRRPAAAVAAELSRRWRSLFQIGASGPPDGRLNVSSAALRPRVAELFPAEAFPAGGGAWPAARMHSPDLQFCADSPEALARSEFTAVLGEMHAAWAAAGSAAAVVRHPEPSRLRHALRTDMAGRGVYPLLPLEWPRNTPRLSFALEDPRDPQLGFAPAPGADYARLVPISSIVVTQDSGGLMATAPDGRRWRLIEVFGRLLSELAVEAFKSVSDVPYTPRITVDRLVVARESWRMPVSECPVTSAPDERSGYLAARRWKLALGLPDYVFVKLNSEVKPVFIDLTSPAYTSVLAADLRAAQRRRPGAASLTVTEMLPAPDQAWLPDAEGRRYVSELRLHVRDDRFVPAETGGTR